MIIPNLELKIGVWTLPGTIQSLVTVAGDVTVTS